MSFSEYLKENYEMTEAEFNSLESWAQYPITKEYDTFISSIIG